MNKYELGKRIKEARLAKKMTQTDVAGDFITRNMLSQIESGSANPSLKTLEYIASVLNIPMSTLLPDGNEEEKPAADLNSPSDLLITGKSLFNSGSYKEAAEKVEPLINSDLWDEAYAIMARAYLKNAEAAEKENDFILAAELADKAYACAEKGIYSSRDIKTASSLLLNKIAEKLQK